MAKNEKSASEQENVKLHGEKQAESREIRSEELSPHLQSTRRYSDEDLRKMERGITEPSIKLSEVPEDDGRRVLAANVEVTAAPSPDSADYIYRDIKGTSIVGHQEQVLKDSE